MPQMPAQINQWGAKDCKPLGERKQSKNVQGRISRVMMKGSGRVWALSDCMLGGKLHCHAQVHWSHRTQCQQWPLCPGEEQIWSREVVWRRSACLATHCAPPRSFSRPSPQQTNFTFTGLQALIPKTKHVNCTQFARNAEITVCWFRHYCWKIEVL